MRVAAIVLVLALCLTAWVDDGAWLTFNPPSRFIGPPKSSGDCVGYDFGIIGTGEYLDGYVNAVVGGEPVACESVHVSPYVAALLMDFSRRFANDERLLGCESITPVRISIGGATVAEVSSR